MHFSQANTAWFFIACGIGWVDMQPPKNDHHPKPHREHHLPHTAHTPEFTEGMWCVASGSIG